MQIIHKSKFINYFMSYKLSDFIKLQKLGSGAYASVNLVLN